VSVAAGGRLSRFCYGIRFVAAGNVSLVSRNGSAYFDWDFHAYILGYEKLTSWGRGRKRKIGPDNRVADAKSLYILDLNLCGKF